MRPIDEHDWLAERFEADRTHLRAVAYRLLGSVSEADDSVPGTRAHQRLDVTGLGA
jgi:DNA-directed RNA polymerase specialized sigma24 family protein